MPQSLAARQNGNLASLKVHNLNCQGTGDFQPVYWIRRSCGFQHDLLAVVLFVAELIARHGRHQTRGQKHEERKLDEQFVVRAWELISRMGGELRVESAPGEGSTFKFVLSFETVHDTLANLHRSQVPQGRSRPSSQSKSNAANR